MKRRVFLLVLAFALCVGVLQGCDADGDGPKTEQPFNAEVSESADDGKDDASAALEGDSSGNGGPKHSDGAKGDPSSSKDEGVTLKGDEALPVENYDWWDGYWYGWWCLETGRGVYESVNGYTWDAYAEIDVYDDGTGFVVLWDAGTTRDDPLAYGYEVTFGPGVSNRGQMVSSRVEFFPAAAWDLGTPADPMSDRENGWIVDPADSTVQHFDDMIEICGHYRSPINIDDSFDYTIYLRPWGMKWDDVRYGDTSTCPRPYMMPVSYDDWYLYLLNLGYDRPPYSFDEGVRIILDSLPAGDAPAWTPGDFLNPDDKEDADGWVELSTLKNALEWCKSEASYDTSYDEIAAQFGAHGKAEESMFEGSTVYKWWATEDIYVKITFTVTDYGAELWNVTQHNGL